MPYIAECAFDGIGGEDALKLRFEARQFLLKTGTKIRVVVEMLLDVFQNMFATINGKAGVMFTEEKGNAVFFLD